jgi:hypothetical protein
MIGYVPAQPRTLDVELLHLVLKHIIANPEQWRQSTWGVQLDTQACGTAFCFAGWVAKLDGVAMRWDESVLYGVETPGGWESPGVYARNMLGLDAGQALELFNRRNTLPVLEAMVEALTADPHVSRDELHNIAFAAGRRFTA